MALARQRLERGAEDDALAAVEGHEGDFAAEGIAARIQLAKAGVAAEAFEALDRGERDAALDVLFDTLAEVARSREGEERDELREQLRRAIVGILSETPPDDPTARDYRRRLATALY